MMIKVVEYASFMSDSNYLDISVIVLDLKILQTKS